MLSVIILPSFLIFLYAWAPDWPAWGIRVSVLQVPSDSITGFSSLSPMVRVADAGSRKQPMLYVNSKPVKWDELGDALTNELKLRPDWVVYVEADEEVRWSDVVAAMDIIRSRHARIVLLTARTTSASSR
jgi:hypothetical protein